MGVFSWITQDTKKSIAVGEQKIIYMLDNKGNIYKEDWYGGYGVFGGKDYYELLAEMNGFKTRNEGIDLEYSLSNNEVLYPNLVEDITAWGEWKNERPRTCPHQGYFY
jgi:hypothetical protein